MNFTQKEMSLLKDMKGQEELCIEKYGQYSADACDSELKNLFSSIRSTEQQHLKTLDGYLGESSQLESAPLPQSSNDCRQNDKFLCQDALAMEKHASAIYDTGIFEFADPAVRKELNGIQSAEQNHGQQIWQYMSQHGMY